MLYRIFVRAALTFSYTTTLFGICKVFGNKDCHLFQRLAQIVDVHGRRNSLVGLVKRLFADY